MTLKRKRCLGKIQNNNAGRPPQKWGGAKAPPQFWDCCYEFWICFLNEFSGDSGPAFFCLDFFWTCFLTFFWQFWLLQKTGWGLILSCWGDFFGKMTFEKKSHKNIKNRYKSSQLIIYKGILIIRPLDLHRNWILCISVQNSLKTDNTESNYDIFWLYIKSLVKSRTPSKVGPR